VLAAITQYEVLGFQVFRGSVKGQDFGCFLLHLVEEHADIFRDNYLMLFDNAPIHRANVIRPILAQLHYMYNTPYSPSLNAIEEYFSLWKRNFRLRESNDEYQVVYNLVKSVLLIKNPVLLKLHLHALKIRVSCLQRKEI
jgi:hypothetical protein